MSQTSLSILVYIVVLVLVLFVAKLLAKPLKIILRLALSSVFGCILLVIINLFSAYHGIYIGINPVTAAVCGLLGLPGIVLLILLTILL